MISTLSRAAAAVGAVALAAGSFALAGPASAADVAPATLPAPVSAEAFGPGWVQTGTPVVADLDPIGPCGAAVFTNATDLVGSKATSPGGQPVIAGTLTPAADGGLDAMRDALRYCAAVQVGSSVVETTRYTVADGDMVAVISTVDGSGVRGEEYSFAVADAGNGRVRVSLVDVGKDVSLTDAGLYADAVADAYGVAETGGTPTAVPALGQIPDPNAPTAPAPTDPQPCVPFEGGNGTSSDCGGPQYWGETCALDQYVDGIAKEVTVGGGYVTDKAHRYENFVWRFRKMSQTRLTWFGFDEFLAVPTADRAKLSNAEIAKLWHARNHRFQTNGWLITTMTITRQNGQKVQEHGIACHAPAQPPKPKKDPIPRAGAVVSHTDAGLYGAVLGAVLLASAGALTVRRRAD